MSFSTTHPKAQTHPVVANAYRAFFEELSRLGYVERQNLGVERYTGEGRPERYGGLVRDVVGTHPDLILTLGALVYR